MSDRLWSPGLLLLWVRAMEKHAWGPPGMGHPVRQHRCLGLRLFSGDRGSTVTRESGETPHSASLQLCVRRAIWIGSCSRRLDDDDFILFSVPSSWTFAKRQRTLICSSSFTELQAPNANRQHVIAVRLLQAELQASHRSTARNLPE